MHHITSSVTYRDLKLLELNFMWGGDKSNDTSSHWTKNHLTLFWIRWFWRFLNAEKSVLWTRSRRILSAYTGVWGSPNKRFVAMDSHEHCLLILYKAKTKNFSKDSIASLSTTSFGKQGLRIYKAVMLVGAMPQILWTVMEHHRLCTVEYNHFLVQNSFTDFINLIKRN